MFRLNANDSIRLPVLLRFFRQFNYPRKFGILERIYGSELQHIGICLVQTSNAVIWKLDLSDVTQRWIVYGDYEGTKQMSWIRQWLSGGGDVIDSGANIGQMLLYLAPMQGVKVYAFEPLEYAYKWLLECLERYPEWHVSVEQCGLSSTQEEVAIQVDGGRSTTRMDWYKDQNLPIIQILVIPLDDYLQQVGLEKIRLWKLDVEGHELEALRGARNALQQHKVDAILVEMSMQEEVTAFLDSVGYQLYRIGRNGELLEMIGKVSNASNMVALPRAEAL